MQWGSRGGSLSRVYLNSNSGNYVKRCSQVPWLVCEEKNIRATTVHPDPQAAISLAVDASDRHVGAVLQQWQQGMGPPGLLQQEVGGRPAKVLCFRQRIAGGIPGGQAFPQHGVLKRLTFSLH